MSRISEGYEPRFDIDYSYGFEGERYIADIIDGITSGKVEVKRDAVFHDTGNVYIEYMCQKNGQWTESGINTTTADVWIFVLGDSKMFIGIKVAELRELAKHFHSWGCTGYEKDGSHPTRGVIISAKYLMQYAQNKINKTES